MRLQIAFDIRILGMPNLSAMQPRPLRIRRIVVALMAIAATLLPALGAPGWSSPAAAQGTCGNTDATPRLTVTPTALPAAATSTIEVCLSLPRRSAWK